MGRGLDLKNLSDGSCQSVFMSFGGNGPAFGILPSCALICYVCISMVHPANDNHVMDETFAISTVSDDGPLTPRKECADIKLYSGRAAPSRAVWRVEAVDFLCPGSVWGPGDSVSLGGGIMDMATLYYLSRLNKKDTPLNIWNSLLRVFQSGLFLLTQPFELIGSQGKLF